MHLSSFFEGRGVEYSTSNICGPLLLESSVRQKLCTGAIHSLFVNEWKMMLSSRKNRIRVGIYLGSHSILGLLSGVDHRFYIPPHEY